MPTCFMKYESDKMELTNITGKFGCCFHLLFLILIIIKKLFFTSFLISVIDEKNRLSYFTFHNHRLHSENELLYFKSAFKISCVKWINTVNLKTCLLNFLSHSLRDRNKEILDYFIYNTCH